MKILTADEMRETDRITSERYAVPSLTLMENAGTAVAKLVAERYPWAQRISIICGKGNNGGDGFVAARKLRQSGKEVQVLLLADPAELRGDAAEMFCRLSVKPALARNSAELEAGEARAIFETDVLVDAILGTGFRPPVQGLYAEAIARINASGAPVIAVDIPSGADADVMGEQGGAVARADAVVSFTAPRPAHVFGRLTEGPIIIAPIGSPEEAIQSSLQLSLITPYDIARLFAPRLPDANKGTFGHVLVIGGSLGKAGAAAMAGMSALKAGAGLSTVATGKSVLATVAGFYPELMTEALAETEAGTISMDALEYMRLDKLVEGKTVLAVGPGISRNSDTAQFVRTVVNKYQTPIVLDADGLNAFEGRASELTRRGRTLVITPHPGEMARLTGQTVAQVQHQRLQVARDFAREHELIVVLKGHRTLVAGPDGTVWVNTTGNAGMATGGTGDILTGMVAGLMAQNRQHVTEAVIAAVHFHGLAGDVARERMGEHSLTATDLIRTLPEAIHRAARSAGDDSVTIAP